MVKSELETMTEKEEAAQDAANREAKIREMYEPGYSGNLSIHRIEAFTHGRADEVLDENLGKKLSSLYRVNFEGDGKPANVEELANEYMKILAEAHFGEGVLEDKDGKPVSEENREKIFNEVQQAFGVSRKEIREAFSTGAYKDEKSFLERHKDQILGRHGQYRQNKVAVSLREYIGDLDQREELIDFLEHRTGLELKTQYKNTINEEKAIRLISAYLSKPDSIDSIGRMDDLGEDKYFEATKMPTEIAGRKEVGQGVFKGFPALEKEYKKQAEYLSGKEVDRALGGMAEHKLAKNDKKYAHR